MLNPSSKRYFLPFSPQKNSDGLSRAVELAAIYALLEQERAKGGGLIVKQQQEKLVFISKMGYPIWLFPTGEVSLIFDGINDSTYTLVYYNLPSTEAFSASIENASHSREIYLDFLSDNADYFENSKKASFTLHSLISSEGFKEEFNIYRKEATEITIQPPNITPFPPLVQEASITTSLSDLAKLQQKAKADAERVADCLRQVNKLTSQYLTEIDYAAEAATDEIKAKIKATEELVNPKISKLQSDYKKQIAQVTRSFNNEQESLQKMRDRTLKSTQTSKSKIQEYEREAKDQAIKNHKIYAKSWKEKSRQTKKEIDGLEKDLGRIEKNIKTLNKQKTQKISEMQLNLDKEIKYMRAPLVELEAARDLKLGAFKREAALMLEKEKQVVDALNGAIKLGETVRASYLNLGISDALSKSPALFYVPFYIACYKSVYKDRYLVVSPSTASGSNFGSKLKNMFGKPKIKELLTPRFKEVTALISQLQTFAEKSSQIRALGEKANLLNSNLAREEISRGLAYLETTGWLSSREHQLLIESLA